MCIRDSTTHRPGAREPDIHGTSAHRTGTSGIHARRSPRTSDARTARGGGDRADPSDGSCAGRPGGQAMEEDLRTLVQTLKPM